MYRRRWRSSVRKEIVFELDSKKDLKIEVGAFFHWLHAVQPNASRLKAGWGYADLVLVFILRLCSFRSRS